MRRLINMKKKVEYLEFSGTQLDGCSSCEMGKFHKMPFPKSGHKKATNVLQLCIVHADLWGKAGVEAKGGYLYFVSFNG